MGSPVIIDSSMLVLPSITGHRPELSHGRTRSRSPFQSDKWNVALFAIAPTALWGREIE
jgi:hypothetical protein